MLNRPRRFRLADFEGCLNAPSEPDRDWYLRFPFRESFVAAFEAGCDIAHTEFQSSPDRDRPSTWSYLKDRSASAIEEARKWLREISPYVGIRDCLSVSFAIDYDRERGAPDAQLTPVGRLRRSAKEYRGGDATSVKKRAADELVDRVCTFLESVQAYRNHVDCIVAVPPSSPNPGFHLPDYIAEGVVSRRTFRENLSEHVNTVKDRPRVKDQSLENKLECLKDTIAITADVFKRRSVLLVDDLYQSGITMNYVGMLLKQAGAKRVLGLACEKTCRNDDNLSGRAGERGSKGR